ncbi:MAG: ATP-binding protein [TACK group archaeon]|nr:ATP-binding protein [TACK group archaeon]
MSLNDTLRALNSWWISGQVSGQLAKPYRRKAFAEAERLFVSYRQIVMLVGLRRVGKSTMVYQLISDLLVQEDPKRVVYFSFDEETPGLLELLNEYRGITGVDWKRERVYIFLDELQKLPGWDAQLKLIYDSFPNLRIVVSGSASLLIEQGARSNLAGRYFAVEVEPLDLVEFFELKRGIKVERLELYRDELKAELPNYPLKAFPEIVSWPDSDAKTYLREAVVSKITRKDLPDTFSNVNFKLLEAMTFAFYARPGMMTKVDDLSREFGVSKTTLENHLFYLEFSRLIRVLKNYRPSSMAESRKLKRVYPYNVSLALAYHQLESGPLVETLVAGAIGAGHYWRSGGKEVDFLLKEPLTAVEAKAGSEVSAEELKGLRYFVKRFGCRGFVVYGGRPKREDELSFVPLLDVLAGGQKALLGASGTSAS